MGRGGNGNLIAGDERSQDELRENGKKGGIKSGEARRRKKTMREALEKMLYDIELDENTKNLLRAQGIENVDDFTHQMVVTRSLIAKAEAGDVQAYHAICGMIGEKPTEKMEVSGDLFSKLRVVREHREGDKAVPRSEDEIPE